MSSQRVASRLVPLLVATFLAGPAAAQQAEFATPPHLSSLEGQVEIEREGLLEDAASNLALVEGDRILTREGRAEILFADGSVLWLDRHTAVDLLSGTLLRLVDGRIQLSVSTEAGRQRLEYRVDAANGSAWLEAPGEYRLSLVAGVSGPELEVAVVRGMADLVSEGGSVAVRAGERALAGVDAAPPRHLAFNAAQWDVFDRWMEQRRQHRVGRVSARHLPAELLMFSATLDRFGTWRPHPRHGQVWFPRVASAWKPFHFGRWIHRPHFGWTWLGFDPWAWPTHHFGFWGFQSGAWFWIPGRQWAPAWVFWAVGPTHIGWSPLGVGHQPVFSFATIRTLNVFAFGVRDPWRGWTIVPRRAIGLADPVVRHAVPRHHVDARALETFITQPAVPLERPTAVARTAGTRRAAAAEGIAVGQPQRREAAPRAVPRDQRLGTEPAASAPIRALPPRAQTRRPRQEEAPGTALSPEEASRVFRGPVRRAVPRTPGVSPYERAAEEMDGAPRREPNAQPAPQGQRRALPVNPRAGSNQPSRAGSPAASDPARVRPSGERVRRPAAGRQPSGSRQASPRAIPPAPASRAEGQPAAPTRRAPDAAGAARQRAGEARAPAAGRAQPRTQTPE